MERIVSARLNESVAQLLDSLSRELHLTKKKILEDALLQYCEKLEHSPDLFEMTCGIWRRNETATELHQRTRAAFEASVRRHHL